MQSTVALQSHGLDLSGIVHTPEGLRADERRPAFLVLHGFGGNKEGRGQTVIAEQLAAWGYVALRFDFRGCGGSGGERGRILCLDQVADTSSAPSSAAASARPSRSTPAGPTRASPP